MKVVRRFVLFWYHFIVGDDWKLAAGAAAGLGLTGYIAHATHLSTWWLLPVVVVVILTLSLWLAVRQEKTHR